MIDHPKARFNFVNKVYVAIEDTSPEAMGRLYDSAKAYKMPGRTVDAIRGVGAFFN